MRTVTLKAASELKVGDVISSPRHNGIKLNKAKIGALTLSGSSVKIYFEKDFKWCDSNEEFIVEEQ